MSLWPRLAGFAVPDTPLFHSLIKPATVNSRKTQSRRGSHKRIAHWHQLFTLPASGFQEIAGFGGEKQQVEAGKVHPPVTAWFTSPVACLHSSPAGMD